MSAERQSPPPCHTGKNRTTRSSSPPYWPRPPQSAAVGRWSSQAWRGESKENPVVERTSSGHISSMVARLSAALKECRSRVIPPVVLPRRFHPNARAASTLFDGNLGHTHRSYHRGSRRIELAPLARVAAGWA